MQIFTNVHLIYPANNVDVQHKFCTLRVHDVDINGTHIKQLQYVLYGLA